MPVATYASLDKTLNAGHELLPLRMITDVTTSADPPTPRAAPPPHRGRPRRRRRPGRPGRRADRLGGHDLRPLGLRPGDVRADGRARHLARLRAARPSPTRAASSSSSRADAWPHVKGVFDTFHARQRGSVEWPCAVRGHPHRRLRLQRPRPQRARSAPRSTSTRDGTVDGFVLYKPGEDNVDQGRRRWSRSPRPPSSGSGRSSAHMDRVTKVTFNLAHPDDPLAVGARPTSTGSRSPRSRSSSGSGSSTSSGPWRRARGPPTARSCSRSTTRRATRPGASGRDRRTGGRASTRTERAADVTLTAETLGSLYLGGVPVSALRRAGPGATATTRPSPLRRDGGPQRAAVLPDGVLTRQPDPSVRPRGPCAPRRRPPPWRRASPPAGRRPRAGGRG